MARKKLLDFRTRKIKDWNLSKSALKKFAKSRPKVDKPQKIRARRTAVKARQIRKLPSEIEFKHLVRPEFFWNRYFGKAHLKYRVRKNQKDLSPIEWQRFIYAIEALADSDMPSPTFQDFVQVHRDAMHHHVGMTWKAHRGINFLTWHREYLVKLEARLMAINPLVTIPYWNWIEDRDIPEALNNPCLL